MPFENERACKGLQEAELFECHVDTSGAQTSA